MDCLLSLPPSLAHNSLVTRHSPKQAVSCTSRRKSCTVLVRARRGNGVGEEESARPSLGVSEEAVGARPLWQRAWGWGTRTLGYEEKWKEDPRGRQELEELDSFLEGKVDFRWKDVLDPSVENVLALVLTGLFLYAIVLIGWQLLVVAAAITLSALKYAVIAAVILGVLIFFI